MSGFDKGQLQAAFAAIMNTVATDDPQLVHKKADANQAKQTEIELNTARKEGGAHSIGRIETALDQRKKYSTEKQRKKDKKFSDYIQRLEQQRQDLQLQLEWLIHYFEQKAREAQEEADKLRKKIADNYEQMGKNSDFIGAVDKLLKAHERGEPLDQEKLRKLLKEQGAKVDNDTPLAILLQTAEEMIIKADDDNRHLEIDASIYEKEADKYDAQFEKYSNKVEDLKAELDDLKAQNLSEEEYLQREEKIWEGVSDEARNEYENQYGDSQLDKNLQMTVQTKEEQAQSFDALAMMDEPIGENIENPQKKSVSPTPSIGM
jgi:DNA repair exonuclease SbcCD ATPase subunit